MKQTQNRTAKKPIPTKKMCIRDSLKLALAYFARCGHNKRGSAVYIVFCDVNIEKRVKIPYSLKRIVRGERRAEIGNADVV